MKNKIYGADVAGNNRDRLFGKPIKPTGAEIAVNKRIPCMIKKG